MPRLMRGRPILGAAVVIGASRSAARHEVAKQNQLSAEAQRQADAAHQQQMREEEARDQKTQLAIQAALKEERSRSKSPRPPIDQIVQSGQARGAVIGYCAACGTQRIAPDRFCRGCGMMHAQLNNAGGPPPQYWDSGDHTDDSKNLLA